MANEVDLVYGTDCGGIDSDIAVTPVAGHDATTDGVVTMHVHRKFMVVFFCCSILLLGLCAALFSVPSPPHAELCSQEWAESITRDYVAIDDGYGHGPDLLDLEWFSSLEGHLQMEHPDTRDKRTHCAAVAKQIATHRYIHNRLTSQVFLPF